MNPADEIIVHSASPSLERLVHAPPRTVNRRRPQNQRRPGPVSNTPFLLHSHLLLLILRSHVSRLIHESRGSIHSGRGKINHASRSVSQLFHQSARTRRRNGMQDQAAPHNLELFGLAVGRRHARATRQKAPRHPLPRVAAAQNQNVQSFTTSPVSPVRASALESRPSLE
jgi:hypothetical protein